VQAPFVAISYTDRQSLGYKALFKRKNIGIETIFVGLMREINLRDLMISMNTDHQGRLHCDILWTVESAGIIRFTVT
jgi:hypothetical protein